MKVDYCPARRLFCRLVVIITIFAIGACLETSSGWAKTKSKPAPTPVPEKTESGGTAMSFTLIRQKSDACEPNCPQWIAAEGEITDQTPTKLAKFLANPEYRRLPIMLNSPGGKVNAAMSMGQMIRKYGMNTAVAWSGTMDCSPLNTMGACTNGDTRPSDKLHLGFLTEYNAYCNSACSWLLLAGTVRIVGSGATVGLHQPHGDYTPWIDHYWDTWRIINGKKHIISRKFVKRVYLPAKHEVGVSKAERPRYLKYISQMGGHPEILDEMDKASPKDLNSFNHGSPRLKELGLVTDEKLDASTFVSVDRCKISGKLPSNCVTLTPQQLAILRPPPPITLAATVPEKVGQPPASTDMTFTVMRLASDTCAPRCVEWIAADGNIVSDTPTKLEALLSVEQNRKLPVMLNSAGGNGDAAMALGRVIHKYGMDTAVASSSIKDCPVIANCILQGAGAQPGLIFSTSSRCDDACTLALLGGALRIADSEAHISVRPAVSDLPFNDTVRTRYASYLKEVNAPSALMIEYDYGSYHSANVIEDDKRQSLGLVSNNKIRLSRLVSNGHCISANTFTSNCVAEEIKKQAAPELTNGYHDRITDRDPVMSFTLMRLDDDRCKPNCPQWIAASGRIMDDTASKLANFLIDPNRRKLPILVRSHGGALQAAMTMGRLVRKMNMNVAVAGSAYSGCSIYIVNAVSCILGKDEKVHAGNVVESAGYCENACIFFLLGGATRIAESHTQVTFSYMFQDTKPAVLRFLSEMNSNAFLWEQISTAPVDGTGNLNQARRQSLGLVSSEELTVSDLVDINHCKVFGKFTSNCAMAASKPIQ